MSRYLPLSPQRFATLRWQRFTDYRHARDQHLVPLAAPEVSRAAAHLPLVFARDARGIISLCALTGLREGTNHCLDASDAWQAGYVPAWLRSHPFRLLAPPKGQGEPSQRVLCVDVDSPWVSEQGDEAFLDGETMPPAVQQVFTFLGQMARHYPRTDQAVKALDAAGVLSDWPLSDHHGRPIRGLLRLDEGKLAGIDAETLGTLHRAGALPLAYAQAISTHQLPALKTLAEQHDADYRHVDLDAVFEEEDDELNFDFD